MKTAHPRSRGENGHGSARASAPAGSSPLTRGKPPSKNSTSPTNRLIPAHAGKTPPQYPERGRCPAHPRSRGENDAVVRRLAVLPGSSPLTRGKRWYVFVDRFAVMAHPRSRGENPRRPRGATVRAGSSPLTRGKPSSCTLRPRTTRLIPAHAGKTAQIKPGKDLQRAHPRSRGENVPGPPGLVPTQRLIPAHAGKTAM